MIESDISGKDHASARRMAGDAGGVYITQSDGLGRENIIAVSREQIVAIVDTLVWHYTDNDDDLDIIHSALELARDKVTARRYRGK